MIKTQNLISEISTKIQINVDNINKHFIEIGLKEVFAESYKEISGKILTLKNINIEELLKVDDYEEIVASNLLDIYKILVDFDKVQKVIVGEEDLIFSCLQNLESFIKKLFDVTQYEEINIHFDNFKKGFYENTEMTDFLYYFRDLV